MALCGIINSNLLIDCVNPLIGGVKDLLYIFNYDDLADYNVDANGFVTSISLLAGKNGYIYEGQKSSIDIKANLQSAKYSVGFNHEITFRVFSNDANTKKQLTSLARGKFIAIVENNYRGAGDASSFEIYGLNSGLRVASKESNKSDADTQGTWVLNIASAEIKEPFLPRFVFSTSYSVTKTLIEALLTTGTIPSNALLGEDGQPILNEDGNYILNE
jgi:hypothetical protein